MSSTDPQSLPKSQVDEFVRLLSENERRLFAFILASVPDWTDADEIAQQVRVRLWEQFGEYDPTKNFGAWSRTIAYYLILAHRKALQRLHPTLSQQFLETVSACVEETTDEVDDRRAALAKCLDTLSDSNRNLIRRYYAGEEDRRAMATDMGRTFDALRQSVQRIRNSLGKCIDENLNGEESI